MNSTYALRKRHSTLTEETKVYIPVYVHTNCVLMYTHFKVSAFGTVWNCWSIISKAEHSNTSGLHSQRSMTVLE